MADIRMLFDKKISFPYSQILMICKFVFTKREIIIFLILKFRVNKIKLEVYVSLIFFFFIFVKINSARTQEMP